MVVGELAYEKELVIIGGGPGGYHAAIRAAQLGQKVTLIEKGELGGVCLNEGCIPSKVITTAASRFQLLRESEEMGIGMTTATFQYSKLLSYQEKTIKQLKTGVQALIKANKVELIKGSAYFLSENRIGVEGEDHYDVYQFKKAIIATGSQVSLPLGIKADGKRIFHSKMILHISEIPKHLLIYGNNEVALEMANSFHTFGSEVTLLMAGPFRFDQSIEKEVNRQFKKKKITVIKDVELLNVSTSTEELILDLRVKEERISLTGSHLFLSTPNLPNTKDLGLEKIGIEFDDNGFIRINSHCQTSIPTIYAIGDVTEGPALAVKAISQGKVAAEAIAGKLVEFDGSFLPRIVHFEPPVATVGLTEQEAQEAGINIKVGQFSLSSNGYATIGGKKDGFIKVISDADNDTLLGIHMMGEGTIELISSGVLSLEMVARVEDLKFPFYPHPSINEGLLEAVEALTGEAIHASPAKVIKKEIAIKGGK